MNSMKRQKDMTLKDELPRLVGAQYATGEQWRNNSRENEDTKPKQNIQQMWDSITKCNMYVVGMLDPKMLDP